VLKHRARPSGRDAVSRWGAVWLLAATLFVSACSNPPSLSPLAPDAVILAFGDSLTHGTGAAPGQSYPSVLQSRIGRTVANAGVPGELSAAGLARLPEVLAKIAPNLVILCHGGNDILRKRSTAAAQENLRQMVALIRASGAQVVLIGVPAPGLILSTAKHYEQLASELSLAFDADSIADILSDNRLKSDTVHPNAAGYSQLAQNVEALLRDAGAL
jgi:acyl-CoA thioesterase-1